MKKTLLYLILCLVTSTTFADSILIEGFEYANHNNETPIGWSCDDRSWLCGYLEQDHNRIPHTGNWYAYSNADESWMFMPLFFSSQLKYRVAFWAISEGSYTLECWAGNGTNPSQMSQRLLSYTVNSGQYESFEEYVETMSGNYEYLGIHAIAAEGASHLTIDDTYIDMVEKYNFAVDPYESYTSLYPGDETEYSFNIHNKGYLPIDVIFQPSHEYFDDIRFYVNDSQCSSVPLETNETKRVTARAVLKPSIAPGTTCWLDIMLVLDCDCYSSMTTLWVTVLEPTETSEHHPDLVIYPNPTFDHIIINDKGLCQVEIIDMSGKTLVSKLLDQGQTRLDISNLKAGVYMVKTISEQGPVFHKIVKR